MRGDTTLSVSLDDEDFANRRLIPTVAQDSGECSKEPPSAQNDAVIDDVNSDDDAHDVDDDDDDDDDARTIRLPTKLHGRMDAMHSLMDAFRLACHHTRPGSQEEEETDGRSIVVLLEGPVGCGKTTLVERGMGFVHQFTICADPIQPLHVAPGFRDAFWGIVHHLQTKVSTEVFEKTRQRFMERFDDKQTDMLGRTYPELKGLFVRMNDDEEEEEEEDNEKEEEKEQMKPKRSYKSDYRILRYFVKEVCSVDLPIIYHYDDSQWIGPHALEWAPDMILGAQTAGAMYVISYTNDDSIRETPLAQLLEDLRNDDRVHIIRISLDNFSLDDTSNMVADMLDVPAEECEAISNFVFDKTKGNPLFIRELLTDCFEDGILQFSERDGWTLSEEERDGHLVEGSYDNVVEYFSKQLQFIPEAIKECLKVGACLGGKFNPALVAKVLTGPVDSLFESAMDMGLIEECHNKHGSPLLRFTHSSIHTAALSLSHNRAATHFAIGRRFLKVLTDEELGNDLLTVTTQLLFGGDAIRSQRERNEIAELCLRATRVCVSYTSFVSANRCIQLGLRLLDQNECWKKAELYDLALAMHNAAAEVAYASGHADLANDAIRIVIENGRTFEDKLQANSTKLQMLVSGDKGTDAINLSLELLKQLGESFPREPAKRHIAAEYLKTRHLLKGKSNEMLARYFTIADPQKTAAMKILNVSFSAFYVEQPILAALVAMRMVHITLQAGVCNYSCVGFATYGMLLCGFLGNIQEGTRFGELSLKLLDRFEAKEFIPRVYVAVYGFIFCWTRPVEFEQLLRGYRVGLETGDIEVRERVFVCVVCVCVCVRDRETERLREVSIVLPTGLVPLTSFPSFLVQFATANVSTYIYYCFEFTPLLELERQRALYLQEVASFDKRTAERLYIPSSDMVRELAGLSKKERCYRHETARWAPYQNIISAFIFCDYEGAVKLGENLGVMTYESVGMSTVFLFRGLANIALFKRTRKQKRKRLGAARSCRKLLSSMAKIAPQFCLSKLRLLHAALCSLSNRKLFVCKQEFLISIALAQANKSLIDEAIACEQYGRCLLEVGDDSSAQTQLRRACQVYRNWNAYRKAEMLESEVAGLFGHDSC